MKNPKLYSKFLYRGYEVIIVDHNDGNYGYGWVDKHNNFINKHKFSWHEDAIAEVKSVIDIYVKLNDVVYIDLAGEYYD